MILTWLFLLHEQGRVWIFWSCALENIKSFKCLWQDFLTPLELDYFWSHYKLITTFYFVVATGLLDQRWSNCLMAIRHPIYTLFSLIIVKVLGSLRTGLRIGPCFLTAFFLSGNCKWLCICILQVTDLKKLPNIWICWPGYLLRNIFCFNWDWTQNKPCWRSRKEASRSKNSKKKKKNILFKLRQSLKKERSIVWWIMWVNVSLDNKCGGSFPSFIAILGVNRGVQQCFSEVLNTCCVCWS